MERAKFAGGDQDYLRDEQYSDGSNLAARAALHFRYGTAATPWVDWVRARIALRAGDQVLEVGCGTGWLWEACSVPLPDGIALTLGDLSPGMVEEAMARAAADGRFAPVTGRTLDAQQLPFDDASFDRVIANHMLYHLPSPEQGVAEIRRVLRPEGVAIIATNGGRHLHEIHEVQTEVLDVAYEDSTLAVFGADVGFGLLRRHFGEVAWEQYPDTLHCTDVDDVLAYICSSPPGEDATAAQRTALRQAIVDRMVEGVFTVTKDTGLFRCVVSNVR